MTDIINSKAFSFTNTEDALNECTRITNLKTGVTECLSPDEKQFFVRMRHRYYRFVVELGGTYYDDIDQLGASIGVSSATATRIVAKLKKVGLIDSNKPKRSNQWTITALTPENFLFERDINAMRRKTAPQWVDCLKHPVFGKAKDSTQPEVQEEKQQPMPAADPMCEFDDTPEEEAPAPEKLQPAPKPTNKPAPKKAAASPQAVSPFEFKKPRDESKDWWYLERYNDADRFTGFTDFDLPYLVMFESQGKLTNQHSIQHLKMKRDTYARLQQT
ncbi:ArsR family transcriptional regulator [Klebsiella pneumoniae]|nr:ArsR family transcriptional regulator [Klebsiella pneumoniae]MCB3552880.1 ArsR family transcriptional regulator [Klebsiella pneumoniae]HBT1521242.1 ArsR family transcriptional regulator [Klebsiella pneumoniae]HDU4472374.1 ArsR family transcriptional regulator [Klebsiella pneumoniae subsp. pneumoniae]